MSQTVNVTLGGENISVVIDGGNMGAGASVGLQELNQAVGEAKQAADDAEASANQAAQAVAGVPAIATAAGTAAGAAAGADAGTATAQSVLLDKAETDASNVSSYASGWRGALGLGSSAILDVGTSTGTVADGVIASKFKSQTNLAAQPNWLDGISPPDTVIMGDTAARLAPPTTRAMIAAGGGALWNATNPENIIALGASVMAANTNPGRHNIGIGEGSFTYLNGAGGGLDATRNVGLGQLTGHFTTTGAFNGYYHRNAGHSNTTGSHNIGVGYRAVGGAENPIGLDGKIVLSQPLTASFQTGIGNDALRYSNGSYNTAGGYACLQHAKGSRNVGVGAGALTTLDRDVSNAGFLIDRTTYTGTYSQSGTTVTVNATGVNVAVGKLAHIRFDSGPLNEATPEFLTVVVTTAPNANSFTFTSPVSQTASGSCTIDWVETSTSATPSVRMTAIGHNAGTQVLNGSMCVLVGAESGEGQGSSMSGKFLLHVNTASPRPLAAGDFVNGRFAVNANLSDLTQPFQVFDKNGKERFTVQDNSFARIIVEDDSASAGPVFIYDRRTASPAAGDILGSSRFYGRDSAGNETNYADDYVTSTSVSDTAESATRSWRTMQAGSMAIRLVVGAGVYHPSSPGGDRGNGSINMVKGWFQTMNVGALPVYADNAAATADGLAAGELYRTATGQVMVRY